MRSVPEFVRFPKCEDDVLIFRHKITSCMIHELERTLIIGLLETVFIREAVGGTTSAIMMSICLKELIDAPLPME